MAIKAVLLQGVNDDEKVLEELFSRLACWSMQWICPAGVVRYG